MVFKALRRRKQIKRVQETLRHARHLRNMREDLMENADLLALKEAEQAVNDALGARDEERLDEACKTLEGVADRLTPKRWRSAVRENIEIAVVAISVAMAFRAYLIQPFKIPTGSMQPTLYGIHAVTHQSPTWMDRMPFKLVKFVWAGSWYSERHAMADGYVTSYEDSKTDPSVRFFFIGNKRHKLPKDASNRGELSFQPGQVIRKGDLLWSGQVTRGDHVFVNKVIWNFRKPKRGEIMVFNTIAIPTLPQGTHYIKRMVGVPNESVSINPPYIYADGKRITEPETISRIAACKPGYKGYRLIHPMEQGHLYKADDQYALAANQYFACGDNTTNSRDSRYWGHVPGVNLVGPAAIVYWPVSKRWGLAH